MVQNRDTQTYFLLGDYNNTYPQLTLQAAAEYGNSDTTFRNSILKCEPICFNQTKHFVRNRTSIKQCRWGIGNVYFNYETIPEQFYNVLKAFSV